MSPDQLKGLVLELPDKFHHIHTTSHAFINFIIELEDYINQYILDFNNLLIFILSLLT